MRSHFCTSDDSIAFAALPRSRPFPSLACSQQHGVDIGEASSGVGGRSKAGEQHTITRVSIGAPPLPVARVGHAIKSAPTPGQILALERSPPGESGARISMSRYLDHALLSNIQASELIRGKLVEESISRGWDRSPPFLQDAPE